MGQRVTRTMSRDACALRLPRRAVRRHAHALMATVAPVHTLATTRRGVVAGGARLRTSSLQTSITPAATAATTRAVHTTVTPRRCLSSSSSYASFSSPSPSSPSSSLSPRVRTPMHLHEERLPLENTAPVRDDDPYKHIRIFRRDMCDGGGGGTRTVPLSVDVPATRFAEMFADFDGRRCKLCNETFVQWHMHTNNVAHSGREAVALELTRAHCGTPDELVAMWWHRLHTSTLFARLPSLSHRDTHTRKRRLQYLLRVLIDRQVLVETFNVRKHLTATMTPAAAAAAAVASASSSGSGGGMQPCSSSNSDNADGTPLAAVADAGRSWEFERLEFVGDNVVKYMFNQRLTCIFPVHEGGIRGKLGHLQFVIDGNEGLARAYDYLELQLFTRNARVVSKFKSDVVETLFAELQYYIWSTQLDVGTEYMPFPFAREVYTLRAVVQHVLEELAHVMFMYHVEHVLGAVHRIVRERQLQFVRAEPLPHKNGSVVSRTATTSALASSALYGGGGGSGGYQPPSYSPLHNNNNSTTAMAAAGHGGSDRLCSVRTPRPSSSPLAHTYSNSNSSRDASVGSNNDNDHRGDDDGSTDAYVLRQHRRASCACAPQPAPYTPATPAESYVYMPQLQQLPVRLSRVQHALCACGLPRRDSNNDDDSDSVLALTHTPVAWLQRHRRDDAARQLCDVYALRCHHLVSELL